MIAPQYGDTVRVNALVGGIYVPQEGIWLKVPGEETDVVWSPFWQGELDLQRICLPVPAPSGDVLIAVAPEDWEPETVVALEAQPEPDPEAKPRKKRAAMAEEPDEDADADADD